MPRCCRPNPLIFGTEGRGSESMGMEKIRHLVVLMLENRSFDNMVGYVYADKANHPPINIPPDNLRWIVQTCARRRLLESRQCEFLRRSAGGPTKDSSDGAGDGLQNADSRSG